MQGASLAVSQLGARVLSCIDGASLAEALQAASGPPPVDHPLISFALAHRDELSSWLAQRAASPLGLLSWEESPAAFLRARIARWLYQKNQFAAPSPHDWSRVETSLQRAFARAGMLLQSETSSLDLAEALRLVLYEVLRARAALLRAASPSGAALREVVCAEYRPELQLQLLKLAVSSLAAPVLDIGCGESAALVRFLRAQGVPAWGLDRSFEENTSAIQTASTEDEAPRLLRAQKGRGETSSERNEEGTAGQALHKEGRRRRVLSPQRGPDESALHHQDLHEKGAARPNFRPKEARAGQEGATPANAHPEESAPDTRGARQTHWAHPKEIYAESAPPDARQTLPTELREGGSAPRGEREVRQTLPTELREASEAPKEREVRHTHRARHTEFHEESAAPRVSQTFPTEFHEESEAPKEREVRHTLPTELREESAAPRVSQTFPTEFHEGGTAPKEREVRQTLPTELREESAAPRDIVPRGEQVAVRGDWLRADFGVRRWGTILSHQGFSLHFWHQHLAQRSAAEEYARAFMRILGALREGGTFAYAPGLPFLEEHLPRAQYRISTHALPAELSAMVPSSARAVPLVGATHITKLR
jgi:hypothetical protein